MASFTYSPKDFVWEIIRRNKNFIDDYESLGVDDNGSKQADPGFCWKWLVKKLFAPTTSIEDIRKSHKNHVIDDANHPVLFSIIDEKSRIWLDNYIRRKVDSDKVIASEETIRKFMEFYCAKDNQSNEHNEKNFKSLQGKQLELFDEVTEGDDPDEFQNESDQLSDYTVKEYVVNVKSITKYTQYLKIYDKVEEVVLLSYPVKHIDGAISLPRSFTFSDFYGKDILEKETEKRVKDFDDSIFNDENYLREMREEHQIKAFDNDRSGKRIGSESLKKSIAGAQAAEAIERRGKRAFTEISNLIVNAPHNIVFKPANIEPSK